MTSVDPSTLEVRLRAIHYALVAIAAAVLTVAAVLLPDGGSVAVVLGVACAVALLGSFLTVTRAKSERERR